MNLPGLRMPNMMGQQPSAGNMIGTTGMAMPDQSQNVGQQVQPGRPPPGQQQAVATQQQQQVQSTQGAPQQELPVQPVSRERQTIWQGHLEWIEKAKNPNDPQKLTRVVPCQVSTNPKDGETDLKSDSWPQKLIMQLMPQQLIGNIGYIYLKNSISVLFHPQNCEALDSLTKVMSSGFAGCVHITSVQPASNCDIKVLILLYTAEKREYLGFIPNDQVAFVESLRKVIQHQKATQALIRQGQQPQFRQQLQVVNSLQQQQLGAQREQQNPNAQSQQFDDIANFDMFQ